MSRKLTKTEIAQIQLDAAITGVFNDMHLVAVHTLSGAASRILSDLVEAASPDDAWHTMAIESNKLSRKEYFDIIRAASNELKHAERDPHAMVSLGSQDVELAIWVATFDLSTLGALTRKCEVYQLWCFARYPTIFAPSGSQEMQEIVELSQTYFGDLSSLSRQEALAAGRHKLRDEAS